MKENFQGQVAEQCARNAQVHLHGTRVQHLNRCFPTLKSQKS